MIALVGAAAPAQSTPADRPGPHQLWDEGQQLLKGRQWDDAEQKFQAMLALPAESARVFQPFAQIGLATVERGRNRAFAGLALLRRVRQALPPMPGTSDFVRTAYWHLLLESARCHLQLGLQDLARDELHQLEGLAGPDAPPVKPIERYAAAVLGIDLELGQSRFAATLQKARRALADRELCAAAESVVPALRLRSLLAEEGLAGGPAAARAVAEDFERLLADPGLDPGLQFTARVHAASSRMAALNHALARAHAEQAAAIASKPSWELCEAEALATRIAAAAGAADADLAPLRARLAGSLADKFEALAKEPPRPGGAGPFQFRTRRNSMATLLSLDRRLLAGDAAVTAAFEHLEQALSVGTLARRLGAKAASLDAVRAHLLPADGGLLLWFAAPVGGHLLAVDRAGAVHVEFAADAVFEADLDAVRAAMARAPADPAAELAALRTPAQRLAGRLLPAAVRERVARWNRVVVVGDETVGATAWQAMPWQDTWLVLAKAVTHVPSASLALALQARAEQQAAAGPPRTGRFVIGDPSQDDEAKRRFGLGPLALSKQQRTLLGGDLRPPRQHTLFGDAATERALDDPAMGRARVLCLVAHGVQDVERERYAGVLLASAPGSDGVLFADEVEQLQVPPLVVLGACSASAGPRRIGDDGANHLGGAFQLAGAQMVLVASGDLPLAGTVELVGELFAGHDRGLDTAEALRLARVRVAATPGREHPWFFAGLRAVGFESAAP